MRNKIFHFVHKACLINSVKIYGSFNTKNFHYSIDSNSTYSDIDGISIYNLPISDLTWKSKAISNMVFKKTGLKIETHLRNERPHGDNLEKHSSYIVSSINTLIDVYKKDNPSYNYLNYIRGKFFLRTIFRKSYFKCNLMTIEPNPYLKEIIHSKLHGCIISNKTLNWISQSLNQEAEVLAETDMLLNKTIDCEFLMKFWGNQKRHLKRNKENIIINDIDFKLRRIIAPNNVYNS